MVKTLHKVFSKTFIQRLFIENTNLRITTIYTNICQLQFPRICLHIIQWNFDYSSLDHSPFRLFISSQQYFFLYTEHFFTEKKESKQQNDQKYLNISDKKKKIQSLFSSSHSRYIALAFFISKWNMADFECWYEIVDKKKQNWTVSRLHVNQGSGQRIIVARLYCTYIFSYYWWTWMLPLLVSIKINTFYGRVHNNHWTKHLKNSQRNCNIITISENESE